jgi:N-acetylglucosamine malate deacetylase 2
MNILSFFAHPDDETMMVGGTLAILARTGAKIHFVSATRGEGGENGEPPLCSQEELGRFRAEELSCAVQALGGAGLEFFDYIDPRVGPGDELFSYSENLERVASQLKEVILRRHAQVLFTHGSNGEYGHPAHLFTHRAAMQAVSELGEQAPLVYSPHASYPEHPRPRLMNRDDPADLVIDITPVLEQKIAAAMCHRTQHALFIRNSSKEAGRLMTVPEVILPDESLHRQYPNVNRHPLQDALVDALRAAGVVREV